MPSLPRLLASWGGLHAGAWTGSSRAGNDAGGLKKA